MMLERLRMRYLQLSLSLQDRHAGVAGWVLLMRSLLTVLLCMGAGMAHADQVSTDLAQRSPDIHWPASIHPERADLFSHNEIVIKATCRAAWAQLVDAERWPQWYANAKDVHLADGRRRLALGAAFTWTTFGTHIDSSVAEYRPYHRLAWFGKGDHILAYHTWLLVDAGPSCRVITEESTSGPPAAVARKSDPAELHKGHALWLESLKQVTEASR